MNFEQYLRKPFCIPYSELKCLKNEKEAIKYIINVYIKELNFSSKEASQISNLNIDFIKLEEIVYILNYIEKCNKYSELRFLKNIITTVRYRELNWKCINFWALRYINKKYKVVYYMKKKGKNYPLPKLTPKIL